MLTGHLRLNRLEKPVRSGLMRASSIHDVSRLMQLLEEAQRALIPFTPGSMTNLHQADGLVSDEDVQDLMRVIPIAQEQAAAHNLVRDNDGWNDTVNSPMLKSAIPWTPLALHQVPLDEVDASYQMPRGSARVEPMTNACLAPNSIPITTPQPPGPQEHLHYLPPAPRVCNEDGPARMSMDPRSCAHLEVRRPGIDYSFVLDLIETDELQRTVESIAMVNPDEPLNVSQTFLPAVSTEFLAVGIKSHSPWADEDDEFAVVQLSTWAVAFHRRVAQLRCIQAGVSRGDDSDPEKRFQGPDDELMPTLPLIRITGMIWEIIFAVDCGDHIELSRAELLGSTGSIPEAYRLLLALRAIGDWVETTFYDRMKELFPPWDSLMESVRGEVRD